MKFTTLLMGLFVFGMMALTLNSCKEKEVITTFETKSENQLFNYSRELTLKSSSNKSYATIKINSNDDGIVNSILENIELEEIFALPNTPNEVQEVAIVLPSQVKLDYNIELKDFRLSDNAIGLSLKLKPLKNLNNARINGWSPDWVKGSYVTTGSGVTKVIVTNNSLQKATTEYYSKSSSWSLFWASEGSRILPANGGYWEYCRLKKHALKVTYSYDRQQGGWIRINAYITKNC